MPTPPETLDDLFDRLVPSESWGDFAERCGVTPRTILGLRKGEKARPHRSTIGAIALALGVSVAELRAAIQASQEAAKK